MTRHLIVLGIILVVLGGSLTALDDDSSGAFPGLPTPTRTAVPRATATPQPEPTSAPEAEVTNREDCNVIRGTDYLSPEERVWYLTNCLGR